MRHILFMLCLLIAGIPTIATANSANGVWST